MNFQIAYKRLIALLLPTFLRRPVLFGLLRAAVMPLELLYGRFCSARSGHIYRLTHNGRCVTCVRALMTISRARQVHLKSFRWNVREMDLCSYRNRRTCADNHQRGQYQPFGRCAGGV